MNIFEVGAEFPRPRWGKQILVILLSISLLFATWNLSAQKAPAPAPPPAYNQQTAEQLQQLVAPIALYPDSLVAQILAASTFPEQVVEADRWLQAHPDLKGDALAQAVDQQPWDPSVKALTAFPSILGNMDKNLSWTSSLGDAYYNQQENVLDAIQVMRQRAEAAGTLKTTPQETIGTDDSTVTVEPAGSDTVYVPQYDPWQAYGNPVEAWPDWYPYPGIWYDGPGCFFGPGIVILVFDRFGHWGCDWHHRFVVQNHNRYYSRSTTFYNRNSFYRGGTAAVIANSAERALRARANSGKVLSDRNVEGEALRVPEDLRPSTVTRAPAATANVQRGAIYKPPSVTIRPFNGNVQAARGYAEPRGQSGVRSDVFSGYDHGGQTRNFSSRGSASFGGGTAHSGAAVHTDGGRVR
jgi:hypothetical protein